MKVVREQRESLIARIRVMNAAVVSLLVAIGASFWFVQVIQGDHFRELAENNRLRKLPIKAPRGLIYDRHGRLLVENIPSYNLTIDRSRSPDVPRSLAFAAKVLERPLPELARLVERERQTPEFKPILIAEHLTLAEVARFGVVALEYPEFEIQVENLRLYRHGHHTANLLGYLGEVTEEEVERSEGAYSPSDLVGKRGIEQVYDKILRGKDGERVIVVDSRGKLLEEYGKEEVEAGKPLHLTLDLDLQQEAIRWFDEPDKVGAVVALDPRNGEILALVSAPSFDPNAFARRLKREEWQAIVGAPHNPLRDRPVQNTYSPGSVFKIVMAAAGLAEGVVSEHDSVYCSGSTVIYGRRFRCWRAGGHGRVDVRGALKHSCDTYFYLLGQRLGIERIARYSRMFGLGEHTGIELRGENRGLVPDPTWSLKVRKHPWYPGETISVSIGQGPILTSPLQVATLTAIAANGGHPIRPHLVRGTKLPTAPSVGLPPRALAIVREGLWAVMNEAGGTAYDPKLAKYSIGGKTGTVQVIGQSARTDTRSLPFHLRDHGWFTSFAPTDNPEIVVVVFIEHGASGSRAAAPVAKALHEKYFSTALVAPAR